MKDVWIENEWEDLCDRLMRTARYCGEPSCVDQAEKFAGRTPPNRYLDLLESVREAARLAVSWQEDEQRTVSSNQDKDIVTEVFV